MQKCKSKREMLEAFALKYQDIPFAFIYRTLENTIYFGECFDMLEDYEATSLKYYESETKKWKNKIL